MTPRRGFGALLMSVAVLLAGCGGRAPAAVDFRPTVPATDLPATQQVAPVIAGVPPCPASLPKAPQNPGTNVLPGQDFACLTKGPSVRLSGLRGRPTVISIWASWCVPCRREIPFIVQLRKDAGTSLRVMGIDIVDNPGPARAAVEDFGMNFASVSDPNGLTRQTVGFPGPPVTLFVDARGVIVEKKIGPLRSQAELDALVQRTLGVTVP